MAQPVYSDEQVRSGFLKQSVWGTAEATSANFIQVVSESVDPDHDVKRRDGKTQRGLIAPHIEDLSFDEGGSMPKLTLAGDVRKNDLAYWLWVIGQNISEEVGTPHIKTFIPPDTHPDFDNDDGCFFTVARDLPPSASGQRFKDMIGQELTLTWDADSDRLQFSLALVGLGGSTKADTFSGTWARAGASYFRWGGSGAQSLSTATIDFGAGAIALSLLAFEMKIAWDSVQGVGIEGGDFQTLIQSGLNMTQKFKISKGTTSDLAMVNWTTDVAVDTVISTGTGAVDADGEVSITGHGKITSVKTINESVLATEIEIELAENPSADEAYTIILADGQDLVV